MGVSLGSGQGGQGGRRRRGKRYSPMSEINVTPFVDVMLVLLIIFMVSAPLLTAGVPLELPATAGKALQPQNKEPVVISVTKTGQVYLGQESDKPIPLDQLGAKLQAIAKSRGGKTETIFVRGDTAAQYGMIARVMARVKQSGFNKLSLVTEIESGG